MSKGELKKVTDGDIDENLGVYSKWPEHGSELGDVPEEGDFPEDHGNGPGSS